MWNFGIFLILLGFLIGIEVVAHCCVYAFKALRTRTFSNRLQTAITTYLLASGLLCVATAFFFPIQSRPKRLYGFPFPVISDGEVSFLIATINIVIVGSLVCAILGIWLKVIEPREVPPNICRNCGYNLTGNESGICSECGTTIESEITGTN